VPPIHDHLPLAGLGVDAKPRPSPAGLVHAQHLHRLGLFGQHRGCIGGDRIHHRRPGQAQVPTGLHHRASTVGDRRAGRGAKPGGQPGPGRYGRDLLGERAGRTVRLLASPPSLAPAQQHTPAADGQIPRVGAHPLPGRGRTSTARWAHRSCLIRRDQVHHPTLALIYLYPRHGQPVQTQQQRRIVGQAHGPLVIDDCLDTSHDHVGSRVLSTMDKHAGRRRMLRDNMSPALRGRNRTSPPGRSTGSTPRKPQRPARTPRNPQPPTPTRPRMTTPRNLRAAVLSNRYSRVRAACTHRSSASASASQPSTRGGHPHATPALRVRCGGPADVRSSRLASSRSSWRRSWRSVVLPMIPVLVASGQLGRLDADQIAAQFPPGRVQLLDRDTV